MSFSPDVSEQEKIQSNGAEIYALVQKSLEAQGRLLNLDRYRSGWKPSQFHVLNGAILYTFTVHHEEERDLRGNQFYNDDSVSILGRVDIQIATLDSGLLVPTDLGTINRHSRVPTDVAGPQYNLNTDALEQARRDYENGEYQFMLSNVRDEKDQLLKSITIEEIKNSLLRNLGR